MAPVGGSGFPAGGPALRPPSGRLSAGLRPQFPLDWPPPPGVAALGLGLLETSPNPSLAGGLSAVLSGIPGCRSRSLESKLSLILSASLRAISDRAQTSFQFVSRSTVCLANYGFGSGHIELIEPFVIELVKFGKVEFSQCLLDTR